MKEAWFQAPQQKKKKMRSAKWARGNIRWHCWATFAQLLAVWQSTGDKWASGGYFNRMSFFLDPTKKFYI